MRQLQAQNPDSNLGQRQVDVYTGLNVMILLLELNRYAIDNNLEEEIAFYPCGKPDENGRLEDPDRFLKIIHYSSCIGIDSFIQILGQFLISSNLNGANLDGVDFGRAHLNYANLNRANLVDAYLSGANLNCANLINAHLSGAHLNYANLNGANLDGVDLSRAQLNGADLSNANLSNAYIFGAQLYKTNLTDTDLNGAQFIHTIQLSPEQVKSAKNWERVTYPVELCRKLFLDSE